MKRRDFLWATPAVLARARAQPVPTPLRTTARRANVLIGSSSEIDLSRDPAYAALIATNVDLFAPNVSWQRMSPTPDQTLIGLDPNIARAREQKLRLTGYHLLWHQRLPPWFDALDRPAAERAITDHIAFLAARFGPETYAWNVVNEAIRPADGLPSGLRRSPLLDKFGTAFFDLAFEAARRLQPATLRLYNDYDLELATPDHQARRRILLRLVDELQARRVPLQAIGLQCHLHTRSFDRFDPAVFHRFLDDLAARGLQIQITELDVHDVTPGDIPTRDARIAEIYGRFLTAALAHPALRSLTFWGLSDRYTWLDDPARPTFNRPDGLPGRPAPFDPAMQPTPAFYAVQRALAAAPSR